MYCKVASSKQQADAGRQASSSKVSFSGSGSGSSSSGSSSSSSSSSGGGGGGGQAVKVGRGEEPARQWQTRYQIGLSFSLAGRARASERLQTNWTRPRRQGEVVGLAATASKQARGDNGSGRAMQWAIQWAEAWDLGLET
jgi:hypothetical protein